MKRNYVGRQHAGMHMLHSGHLWTPPTASWMPSSLLGTCVAAGWLVSTGLAIARPALRLGGEWAGWRCGFDSYNGALLSGSNQAGVTTERWVDNKLQRRSIQLISSEDSASARADPREDVVWATLPVAVSGRSSLTPGARSGIFGTVNVDTLNANAWALDEAVSMDRWDCEAVFDGLGGEQPRERRGDVSPEERTRVLCTFNPNTGVISTGEPVLVWQERCWSVRPSEQKQDSLSDLDATWVSSALGLTCFGGQKRIPYTPQVFSTSHLSLPGGVELRGRPGLLETCVTASPGQANWRKLILRRSWIGGSCFASSETIGDQRVGGDNSDEIDEDEMR